MGMTITILCQLETQMALTVMARMNLARIEVVGDDRDGSYIDEFNFQSSRRTRRTAYSTGQAVPTVVDPVEQSVNSGRLPNPHLLKNTEKHRTRKSPATQWNDRQDDR
jgi:hypothetical protein